MLCNYAIVISVLLNYVSQEKVNHGIKDVLDKQV